MEDSPLENQPTLLLPRTHEAAPKFDGHPSSVLRYLHEIYFLGKLYSYSDYQIIRSTIFYLPDNEFELWGFMPEADGSDWLAFKTAILRLYPEANQDRKYTFADLELLTEKYAETGSMNDVLQFGDYYRDFLRISSFLKSKNRLTDSESASLFLQGFPVALRRDVRQQLRLKYPDHYLDDPWTFDQVSNASMFVILPSNFKDHSAPISSPPITEPAAECDPPLETEFFTTLEKQNLNSISSVDDTASFPQTAAPVTHLVPDESNVAHRSTQAPDVYLAVNPSSTAILPPSVQSELAMHELGVYANPLNVMQMQDQHPLTCMSNPNDDTSPQHDAPPPYEVTASSLIKPPMAHGRLASLIVSSDSPNAVNPNSPTEGNSRLATSPISDEKVTYHEISAQQTSATSDTFHLPSYSPVIHSTTFLNGSASSKEDVDIEVQVKIDYVLTGNAASTTQHNLKIEFCNGLDLLLLGALQTALLKGVDISISHCSVYPADTVFDISLTKHGPATRPLDLAQVLLQVPLPHTVSNPGRQYLQHAGISHLYPPDKIRPTKPQLRQ
ncbi:hypothetical protein CVT26_007514 [Gymnopilus dilepis]|uniref:Uncharacterized protein n=1 Tax=Gymnopilus dilepis TaxID=231916 RepID=A0A409YSR6_9AGAR|nr:hypothetical protein CVT26_007514 [Gymnopilus dilepis]